MNHAVTDLLADCKLAPYWWDDVPRPAIAEAPLPGTVDVAVVGAGYTGLHAALQTARGQRSTLVLDAEEAGWGCSTRNGGQVSTSIKPGFDPLARVLIAMSQNNSARGNAIDKANQLIAICMSR